MLSVGMAVRTTAEMEAKPGLSPRVKLIYLLLAANGVPAFVLLTFAASDTDRLFVWTVKPPASAALLGVMYSNALILVLIGLLQPSWPRVRVILLLVSVFSVAATIVTFFTLDPFLKHPWMHLAYWLTLYLLLFVAAPLVFVLEERESGGRLAVERPLTPAQIGVCAIGAVGFVALGLTLLVSSSTVSDAWPWPLTPLVARIIGVWFSALGVAYAYALWDRDWLRSRPIFWQGLPTGLLLALVPVLHSGDVHGGVGPLVLYSAVAAFLFGGGLLAEVSARRRGAPV